MSGGPRCAAGAATIALAVALAALAGCERREARSPPAAPGGGAPVAGGAADAGGGAVAGEGARPAPRPPARLRLDGERVFLVAPGPGWRLLGPDAAAALDPAAVAGLSDGQRCTGLVRIEPAAEGGLEDLARARAAALAGPDGAVEHLDAVHYAGGGARRAEIRTADADGPVRIRATWLVTDRPARGRALYEVQARSRQEAYGLARRCMDQVTASFELLP